MKAQILLNSKFDEQLANNGFVVVPFLELDKVQDLLEFFTENQTAEIQGFYATAHSSDLVFRKKMNEKIKKVFEPLIECFFLNCLALGGSYVVKSKAQQERLNPHQDWNIVDEAKYRSFNIWVPLIDLNQNNGAIRVVPGSHLWLENYRGPNIPDCLSDFNEIIWQQMVTLNMKAGEALIYDHRLYHASYPNLTEKLRIATVFGVIPKDAKMYYYYGKADDVEVYESSLDFFMEGDIQKGPELLNKVNVIRAPSFTYKSLPSNIIYSGKRNNYFKRICQFLMNWG